MKRFVKIISNSTNRLLFLLCKIKPQRRNIISKLIVLHTKILDDMITIWFFMSSEAIINNLKIFDCILLFKKIQNLSLLRNYYESKIGVKYLNRTFTNK